MSTEPHKRYLVFAYATYYPSGGLDDLVGSFDTVEEAIHSAHVNVSDSVEIYDRVEGVEVSLEPYETDDEEEEHTARREPIQIPGFEGPLDKVPGMVRGAFFEPFGAGTFVPGEAPAITSQEPAAEQNPAQGEQKAADAPAEPPATMELETVMLAGLQITVYGGCGAPLNVHIEDKYGAIQLNYEQCGALVEQLSRIHDTYADIEPRNGDRDVG